MGTPAKLDGPERQKLRDCEEIIWRGLQTFGDVGAALSEIREGKLYRAVYDTFEAYCQDKWGFGRDHAGRQIKAAAVVRQLTQDTTQTRPRGSVLPLTEKHCRPLTGLPVDQVGEAWAYVVDKAETDPDGKPIITTHFVEEAIEEWKRGPGPPYPESPEEPPEDDTPESPDDTPPVEEPEPAEEPEPTLDTTDIDKAVKLAERLQRALDAIGIGNTHSGRLQAIVDDLRGLLKEE